MRTWTPPLCSPVLDSPLSRIDSLFPEHHRISPFLISENQKRRIFRPLILALTEMDAEYLSESEDSHISFSPDKKNIAFFINEKNDSFFPNEKIPIPPPPPSPPAAVEMQRQEYIQQWPPWLRENVAERRRQLDASRELDEPHNLTQEHFGIVDDRFDVQHTLVSNWLDALPERLIDGWETVLKEEVEESFVKRYSKTSLRRQPHIRLEEDDKESEHCVNGCNGDEMPTGCYHEDADTEQEIEDDFLRKVLLGRKRLMQAEISVKRLKMGLKYVASGMSEEFGDASDAQRTRNLLAAVNSTFEEVVRKRLSTATVKGVDPREDYRARLQDLHEREPSLMSRIYTEREIRELKNMVEDILSMDGRRVDGEGKQWFLRNLPRLMELREDMALAEKELERSKATEKEDSSDGSEYDETNPGPPQSDCFVAASVWDLYYMQYCWIQAAFEYRPKGSWEGFEISPAEEAECEDWQLRIEQRVWLQEQFGLNMGTMPWTPFRQANANSTFYV